MKNNKFKYDPGRRTALKGIALGGATTIAGGVGSLLTSCSSSKEPDRSQAAVGTGEMTYRVNPNTDDKVSILGYGCMRWPSVPGSDGVLDQEAVNELVDYAIAHGVNYFDTSPAYCRGHSEQVTGNALARHPRDSYFIATKLSNFAPQTWPREKSMEMYNNSFKYLQTDYIDYLLLHAIGQGGMENFNSRYIDNGMLDFLVDEREAGRIRNLGFSYHGDIEVFDTMLKWHDEGRIHWDFVQIQMNYVDWLHAKEINERNTNGEYLYNELAKRGIPAVIMEPLLGGRLASMPENLTSMLKNARPDDSVASWAFRYAGTPDGILTVLSGMTYKDHLRDNLATYSPLAPISADEDALLQKVATMMLSYPLVQCNDCKYCMPCPHGLDIPGILLHYNKMVNQGDIVTSVDDPNYAHARREFLVGMDRKVPKLRQAAHCTDCKECNKHCPQSIDIPAELMRIDAYAEALRRGEVTV